MALPIEVLFSPAEFRALADRDLSRTTCVVFDVLRATSVMITALANGAAGFLPVTEISEALAGKRLHPEALLAGERGGRRIEATAAGGVEFDFGNSPREFTAPRVARRLIITTTTNGTRALRACHGASTVLVSSFLNLHATVKELSGGKHEDLCLVCAGTGEGAALEDTLAAGALCEALGSALPQRALQDSAQIARLAFHQARGDLAHAVSEASNARRLLNLPDLRDDVEFCLRINAIDRVAGCDENGLVRLLA